MSHRTGALLLALGAGLALADGSIVVLALPELLESLDTTVEGVAAVIGVYTAVLAVALLPAERLRHAVGARRLGAGGLALFAAASLGAGVVDSLAPMLVLRAAQALGGAAALVATFVLLDADGRAGGGGRLWTLAAIGGAAAGPALGGALTQALDWRAIFLAQAPIALAGAVAALRMPATHLRRAAPAPPPPDRGGRAAAALALVSAALTAVLFLLVLVLVAGWSLEPLAGAAAVTILPVAALATLRIQGGDPTMRAAIGCLLVAGGVGALAAVGTASVWWTVAPQLLAGAGMGLALPALGGALLPERTAADAARVLTLRHAGIAVALALLAPLIAGQLDDAVDDARERGAALVLDARLDPLDKVRLAPALVAEVDESDARGELRRALDAESGAFEGDERAEFDRLRERMDQVVTEAVGDGFRWAFVVTAAFAALAALLLLPGIRLGTGPQRRAALAAAAVLALAVPIGTWAAAQATEPEPVEIADPCRPRDLPDTGGLGGLVQDAALVALDRAACRFGSSREELVLALADDDIAERYEAEHGVDPRSAVELLRGVIGF